MSLKILNPTLTKILQTAKLGDVVHAVALPVAVALKLPCIDENKKLRPDSPCAQRRAILNGNLAKMVKDAPKG